MPTAAVRGSSLHYEVAGDGPPVLLIMGFAMRGVGWRPLVDRLLPDHRVAFFDNRGVGASGPPTPRWTIGDFSADATALLDHLGWEQAHIVGVSMGGMIAQHVGLDAPDRVASLSLLATTARGLNASRLDWSLTPRVLRTAFGPRAWRLRALVDLVFSPPTIEARGYEALMAELEPAHGTATFRTLAAHKMAVDSHDTRHRLNEMKPPTLVVGATGDRMIRPAETDLLEELLPQARVVRFDGAGHRVHADRPDEVATALREWFAAHPPGHRDSNGARR